MDVNATEQATDGHSVSLRRLKSASKLGAGLLVSRDPIDRLKEGVRYLPWRRFLELLWSGDLLGGKVTT